MPLENCNTATLQQREQSGACSSLPSASSVDKVNTATARAKRSFPTHTERVDSFYWKQLTTFPELVDPFPKNVDFVRI